MVDGDYCLFDDMPKASSKKLDILPVSVIDIGAQNQIRRGTGGHDAYSSRGNYSHFPSEIASLCYSLYLRDTQCVFDPFAGWGERHSFANAFDKKYIGFDCSQASVDAALNVYGVRNRLANSLFDDLPEFDGVITCPPYWNLETYSAKGIDAMPTWFNFLSAYRAIIERCYKAAPVGSIFCMMTGDWRDAGIYYPLTFETQKAFSDFGADWVDSVVVSRKSVTKIKIMLPQAIRLGYTVKVHETLSVFQKQ